MLLADQSGEVWASGVVSNTLKTIVLLSIDACRPAALADLAALNLMASIKLQGLGEYNHHLVTAGYEYTVAVEGNRLELFLEGFPSQLSRVADLIVARLFDREIPEMDFDATKQNVSSPGCLTQQTIAGYQDSFAEKPVRQASRALDYALGKEQWAPADLIAATKGTVRSAG